MEQAADRFGLRELVVKRHSMLRRQYVHRNLLFLQKNERLARHVKALGHTTREHDHFRPVPQQFLNIGDLDSRFVRSSCLAPIPFARAAGKKLCIFVGFGFALDFQPAPRNVINLWRTFGAVHDYIFGRLLLT